VKKMKYMILGKDDLKGTHGSDSSKDADINKYWELGWETVGSRIDFISFYNQELWDQERMTAVAIEDRMFMYTKMCKNVISYSDFKKLNVPKEDIIFDIPANHMKCRFTTKAFLKPGTSDYYRKEEDRELIFNEFDLDQTISPEKEFVTMCIRRRDWCANRNSSIPFFQRLVDSIKDHHPIYVAGKGNEEFCEQNGINFIEKLKDYVSLIKNKKCLSLVTQSTGLALLALTCAETDVHLIDHSKCSDLYGNHAISGGKCIQFLKGEIYPYFDLSEDTYNTIVSKVLKTNK